MSKFDKNRVFMQSNFERCSFVSDQEKKIEQPQLEKSIDSSLKVIKLPTVNPEIIKSNDLFNCI